MCSSFSCTILPQCQNPPAGFSRGFPDFTRLPLLFHACLLNPKPAFELFATMAVDPPFCCTKPSRGPFDRGQKVKKVYHEQQAVHSKVSSNYFSNPRRPGDRLGLALERPGLATFQTGPGCTVIVRSTVVLNDQSGERAGNAARNFSLLNRIALNLIRKDTSARGSIRGRRLQAASGDTFLGQLLAEGKS
jgi:hypothetical protein